MHASRPRHERAIGDAIRFDTPSGHIMEIYAKMEKVGNGLPLFNPPPMPMDLVGIAPPRLDHCLLTTENVPATSPASCRRRSASASPSSSSATRATS